jgi:hypothetical protein
MSSSLSNLKVSKETGGSTITTTSLQHLSCPYDIQEVKDVIERSLTDVSL